MTAPLFGYRGFQIWSDQSGWYARRILTNEEYDLEGCECANTAMHLVNGLVDAWIAEEKANEAVITND